MRCLNLLSRPSQIKSLIVLCAWLLGLSAWQTTAQQIDNKGTEFILAFTPNFDTTGDVEIHLTGDTATQVTINYPMNSPTFTTVENVVPGSVTVVPIPITAISNATPNTIQDNAIHAVAAEEFVVYTVNRRPQTSDAALGLPVDTMNTQYIVSTYDPLFGSQFAVYASQNNTIVTITPNNNLNGHVANTPFDVTLNRGEVYYAASASTGVNGSLMGTIIDATRPVGLVNGNRCANVPNNTSACDHIYEVAQPVQSWGLSASATNLPNRPSGTIYRIVASEDNTSVEINGIFQGSINRGEFIETPLLTGNLSFSGNNPIFVTQYMPGQSSPGATLGDPAMGNMIPSEQYLTDYTFSTVGDSQFVQNFATIIAANTDVGSLLLDGVPVPAEDFTPFDDIPFSSAVIELTQGTHTTSSLNPHGITVEGYNGFDSYIYPGGALFGFINSQGDPFPPVCSVTMNGDMANGSVSDNANNEDLNNNGQLDPGEDANNNGVLDADTGVFFVNTLSSTNVSVSVSPFAAGDGSVSVTATRIDGSQPGSASIEGVDGAGNSCALEIVFTDDEAMACDIDGDMNVDMDDLMMIRAARNMTALPGDLRDNDANGVINILDFRQCAVQCTQNRCAVL
ncbi:hypothetical protein Patl_2757 [Paraglaciecola sp. T6c]|uniref:hypothetical protein n=1 Tax=Pseudoalteromonas atlantica (strain T6c / ATCC BAA-1087) TaxID=3042615 RepID=UPI0000DA6E23|nr:hypothetical protein [Paraglaciecola sp. T6c]ABG41268.1 hypothetical protein Patl_2757 [Paraglaciecola sp. T6c]